MCVLRLLMCADVCGTCIMWYYGVVCMVWCWCGGCGVLCWYCGVVCGVLVLWCVDIVVWCGGIGKYPTDHYHRGRIPPKGECGNGVLVLGCGMCMHVCACVICVWCMYTWVCR